MAFKSSRVLFDVPKPSSCGQSHSLNKPVAITAWVLIALFALCANLGADLGVLFFLAIPTVACILASTVRAWWPLTGYSATREVAIGLEPVIAIILVWLWAFVAYGTLVYTNMASYGSLALVAVCAVLLLFKLLFRSNNLKTA